MKYRKKPVVIEAVEFQPFDPAPEWYSKSMDAGLIVLNMDGSITIKTLEGDMRCEVGDYVIQGVKGEIYPCKADIFKMTYEPVHE